jgi:hypothetical protein
MHTGSKHEIPTTQYFDLRPPKDKEIPVQVWKGPEVSKNLRLRDFQSAHEGGKDVSPTHRPPLPPGTYSDESTPGPHCGRKDEANKNSNDTNGNRTRDLTVCSAVVALDITSQIAIKKHLRYIET